MKVVKVWRCGVGKDKERTSQSPKCGHVYFGLFSQNINFYCSEREAFIPKSRLALLSPCKSTRNNSCARAQVADFVK